jgi:hypothetical protein
VAFLGVVPSVRLLAAHHRVVHAIESLVSGVWPYYEPDVLVPHCTLATDVADRARVIAAVADADLPINTTAAFAHLVEIPGGWSRFQIPTQ